jgi:hypothetical protein
MGKGRGIRAVPDERKLARDAPLPAPEFSARRPLKP